MKGNVPGLPWGWWNALLEDTSLPPGIPAMVKPPQDCSSPCSWSTSSSQELHLGTSKKPLWEAAMCIILFILSLRAQRPSGSNKHVGGGAGFLLSGLLTLLSFLLAQDVPWASMERTVHWYASVKTELTATTSPDSVLAAPASWGSTASRVSVRARQL